MNGINAFSAGLFAAKPKTETTGSIASANVETTGSVALFNNSSAGASSESSGGGLSLMA